MLLAGRAVSLLLFLPYRCPGGVWVDAERDPPFIRGAAVGWVWEGCISQYGQQVAMWETLSQLRPGGWGAEGPPELAVGHVKLCSYFGKAVW